jgi:tRNA A37 threonylcarbamoyladenosine modification protein TsaB
LTNGAKIYQINSLLLQLPKGNGVSLLDAKGNNFYFGMYKNNKPISKPTMIDGTQAESLVKKHRNKDIFIQYKSVDVFDNLVFHLQNFKLVKNIDALTPLYIKEAV